MVQIKLTAVFAAVSILPLAVVGAPARNFYDREELNSIDSSLVRRAWSTKYVVGCQHLPQLNAGPCGQLINCGCTGLGLFSCHDQEMQHHCKYVGQCGCL
ncbi:hypothetical protein K443DRAFT_675787 [Laccaria amethystina LaAM-08-1]|uniref:Uncharacterized protein n=1 Tax=Laccaria amethystina LaAM-08-1 TaxID=1095629 RepID=A0A0C9XSB6_9AGAR|nr:hypothetical protein K443DRAFT_675787 [Laccaria amethystina LaAM-08-1]